MGLLYVSDLEAAKAWLDERDYWYESAVVTQGRSRLRERRRGGFALVEFSVGDQNYSEFPTLDAAKAAAVKFVSPGPPTADLPSGGGGGFVRIYNDAGEMVGRVLWDGLQAKWEAYVAGEWVERRLRESIGPCPDCGGTERWAGTWDVDGGDRITGYLCAECGGVEAADLGESRALQEFQDVATKHQLRIAKKTLQMNDVFANIMGGMTKDEARAFLRSQGWSDQRIAKLEMAESKIQEATGTEVYQLLGGQETQGEFESMAASLGVEILRRFDQASIHGDTLSSYTVKFVDSADGVTRTWLYGDGGPKQKKSGETRMTAERWSRTHELSTDPDFVPTGGANFTPWTESRQLQERMDFGEYFRQVNAGLKFGGWPEADEAEVRPYYDVYPDPQPVSRLIARARGHEVGAVSDLGVP